MKVSSTLYALRATLLAFLTMLFVSNTTAQTVAAGDIAIVGVNTDGPSANTDEFAIVALAAISPGTTIYISDYYWDNTNTRWGNDGLNGTIANLIEGIIKWTTTSTIAAGSVYKISLTAGTGTPSVTGLPGTLSIASGWTGTNTVGPFGNAGENIFIYQSSNNGVTPSNWIFGWCNGLSTTVSANNAWQSSNSPISGVLSMLPSALTNGTNAISFAQIGSGTASNPSFDNNVYNGTRAAPKATLLAAICSTSNWLGNETTAYDLNVGGTYFPGTNPVFSFVALPVELSQFDANTEGGKNNLTWRTESEKDNSHFDIERSTDGTTFRNIGQVKGNNKPSSYQYTDAAPFTTSYYRLKQVDNDGKFAYSKVVSIVQTSKSKGLTIYPNPVSSHLTIENTEGVNFQILNLLGQQVLAGKATQQIDVSRLPQGTYVLKVGAEQVKFVKQ